ncbi:MAG TPA: ribosome maturation factor RimM [Arenicellales bacterium]|nr:ribosome maturation factor RimM [Arenicellales bacterium]
MSGGPGRRLICVGKIVGVAGVQGWVKIHSYTRRRSDIFDYGSWLVGPEDRPRRHELASGREQGRGLAAKLAGIDDRDAAAALVGSAIHITPEQLPPLAEGEYFWHQLEGLEVENLEGVRLGTVDHLFETGANDVLVVAGERERLIPYIPDVIRKVDLEAGTMQVDWDADF